MPVPFLTQISRDKSHLDLNPTLSHIGQQFYAANPKANHNILILAHPPILFHGIIGAQKQQVTHFPLPPLPPCQKETIVLIGLIVPPLKIRDVTLKGDGLWDCLN
jgi:hypothetical protein